jgi:DNA-binding Lrp family transcriptional regulator
MDDIDRTLIRLLQEDASRPLKALAARVNLSRSSVRDRIARLQAAGIIRRYTIETAQPDTPTAILLIRLARTPDRNAVRAIVARDDVVRCYSVSGDVDLLVEVRGADIARINSARDEIALLPGIADVETSFILEREKAPDQSSRRQFLRCFGDSFGVPARLGDLRLGASSSFACSPAALRRSALISDCQPGPLAL